MYAIINAAVTLDGKIASITGDSKISSLIDLKRVHKLRSNVDAIMIGSNTAIIDNPMLNVRFHKNSNNPTRVIIDGECKIPIDSKIIKTAKKINTIIAINNKVNSISKIKKLKELNVKIISTKKTKFGKVDLKKIFSVLEEMGIQKILIEGGGEINWSCLKLGLVDELRITISPVIIGGKDAKTLMEGTGFSKISQGIKLKLKKIKKYRNDEVVLYYTILNKLCI